MTAVVHGDIPKHPEMSAEEFAFVQRFREEPGDETARLVFADWLDDRDRGEEAAKQRRMAPGYRALVRRGFEGVYIDARADAVATKAVPVPPLTWSAERDSDEPGFCLLHPKALLPGDWLHLMAAGATSEHHMGDWRDYPTREELWDAAALAFADLPESRQQELLAAEVPA